MNSLHAQELQEILLRYPFQSLVVPCRGRVRTRLFPIARIATGPGRSCLA